MELLLLLIRTSINETFTFTHKDQYKWNHDWILSTHTFSFLVMFNLKYRCHLCCMNRLRLLKTTLDPVASGRVSIWKVRLVWNFENTERKVVNRLLCERKTCSADFEILWNWPSSGEANDEDDDEDEEEDHGALRDGPAHHDVVAAHTHRPPRLRVLLHHCLEK